MTRRVRHAWPGLLGALLAACTGAPELALCLRTAPDDVGATSIRDAIDVAAGARPSPCFGPSAGACAEELVLRATPLSGPPVQQSSEPGARALRLPTLDWGRWTFTVEALAGGAVLAQGRTTLVDVQSEDTEVPCLYFATVGEFHATQTPPPPAHARLVFGALSSPTALVATDEGLASYDHETGAFAEDLRPFPFDLDVHDAIWTNLRAGRAAVITTAGVGAILSADGTVERVTPLPDVGPLEGAVAVPADFYEVLLVGGAAGPTSAPATGALRVVDLVQGTVELLPDALPAAHGGHRLSLRDARVQQLANLQVVLAGGNEGTAEAPVPSDVAALIDPTAGVIHDATLAVGRWDVTVAVVANSVLVFGGRDAEGLPVGPIDLFRISSGQLVRQPAPSPLLAPRAGALALVTGDDVLLVGGQTDSAAGDVTAERFRFIDGGTTAVPVPPNVALPGPVAVSLHDGASLVVSSGAAFVYRP